MVDITLGVAFVAGLLSFLSPCVLPLVPGFLAHLAGLDLGDRADGAGARRRVFLNTLAFVTGFTVVFALVGVLLVALLGSFPPAARTWLSRVAGIVIVLFGLQLLGVIRVPFLDTEHRPRVRRHAGYLTSFLLGVTFATGWTPCFGAVLGGILTLAVANPADAFGLLIAYALGLSFPFLIVGASYAGVSGYLRRFARYTRAVSVALGILLVVVGLLVFFDRLGSFGLQSVFDTWYIDRERALLDASAGANLA
jgi:cytochrome c-type biogenesis protein